MFNPLPLFCLIFNHFTQHRSNTQNHNNTNKPNLKKETNMETKVLELTKKDYSVEKIAEELDISIEAVEEILNKGVDMEELVVSEELEIKQEENQTRYYDVIDLEKEFDLLDPKMVRKMISVDKDKRLYLANDLVEPRISKKGSIYFMIKGNYVKNRNIANILKTKLIEVQFTIIDHIKDLPSYIVELHKSILSKRKYIVWKSKRDGMIHIIMEEIAGLERLKNQMTQIEYKRLEEELDYKKDLLVDPIDVEKHEIYYQQEPELFMEKVEELYELLATIKELKSRKISYEERELLKEIKSEIEYII